jgi:CelD/BcsL family acetyltransferase involved in cellulose biosynthesis
MSRSASTCTISVVEPTRSSDWDTVVASFPGGTFFHSSTWARVLKESYGYLPLYLVLSVDGAVAGCLPLMQIDSWLTGRRGVSLPFTDECVPLARDQHGATRLLEAALEFGRKRRWRSFLSQGGGRCIDESASAPPSYYSHTIDLQGALRDVFGRFTDSVRRGIRKAEREGVQVEVFATLEAVRAYYALHCRTRRRHGVPPQPWSFFAQLHRQAIAFGRGFVVLASHGNRRVAGAVFLHNQKHAVYKFGASDVEYQHVRPNNLTIWAGIQHLARLGVECLSLGRTSLSNDGLRRFKLGWGSAEQQVCYLKYDYGANDFTTAADGASGWSNPVFRRLPVLLSRLIGASLYRHWSLWVLTAGMPGLLEISAGQIRV